MYEIGRNEPAMQHHSGMDKTADWHIRQLMEVPPIDVE